MFLIRPKPKQNKQKSSGPVTPVQRRQVRSVYSDQIILDNSVAKCECEIYLPEPTVKFGTVKGNFLYRDSGTLLWGKNCMVYLCKVPVPYSPSDTTLLLKDIGQENEVYLNVVLNRHNRDNLFYRIKEPTWHECKTKVNNSWRTFVLKFNKDSPDCEDLSGQLENIISACQTGDEDANTYLLVASLLKDQSPRNSEVDPGSPGEDEAFIPADSSTNEEQAPACTTVTNYTYSAGEADISCCTDFPPPAPSDQSQAPTPCQIPLYLAPKPCEGATKTTSASEVPPPFDPAPYVPMVYDGKNLYRSTDDPECISGEKLEPEEITDLCDSLHIHPKELPKRLASILDSLGSISERDSENQRIDSGNQKSEELYMQMGVEKKMSAPNPPSARLQEAMAIAKSLQKAINDGDQQLAVMNAVKLAADNNVTVTIEVKEKSSQPDERDVPFNLKVYIEDKDTSGGHIILKVRSTDTIGDLKQRMSFKHQFPEEIQSWIIGKRIPGDHETLGHCKIKGAGHSAYLYLRSPKSVGLTYEAYQKRLREQMYSAGDGSQAIGENQVPAAHAMKVETPYMDMNAVQKTPAVGSLSAGSQPGSREPASATPPFKQAPLVKQEAKGLAENLNIPNQKTPKEKKVDQGKVRGQGHGHIPEDHPREVPGVELNAMLQQFNAFADQERSNTRVPVMHPEEEPNIGWVCSACTYINKPTRPGCEVCTQTRPPDYKVPDNYVLSPEEKDWLEQEARLERQTKEAEDSRLEHERRESQRNYAFLQETDSHHLVPNIDEFTCTICFEDVPTGQGVVLRNCLHHFCKDCLADHVGYSEEAVLQCPFVDDSYTCDEVIQDREIKALVTQEMYDKYLARSLQTAESQAKNSFHCKTADCPGWCIYEDHVNFFVCPVCRKENCLTCKAIHQGMNCKQYQDDLHSRAANDKAASQTKLMIKKMVDDGDAMPCPQCQVIVMKKEGCDWIQCSICKTEICWVTKGPRWGPLGSGDTSGGCKCRVDGQPCHPNCNNCH